MKLGSAFLLLFFITFFIQANLHPAQPSALSKKIDGNHGSQLNNSCLDPALKDQDCGKPAIHKKRVGFYVRHLSIRGTEAATYDYADCNETLLGNESFIFLVDEMKAFKNSADFPMSVREKFQNRFKKNFYECANFEEVESIILKEHIDVLYNQKYGVPDEHQSKICKNAVHAVFTLGVHGDVFAAISEWLSQQDPPCYVPFVPYMVRLDDTLETLHSELNIPHDAIVFGRHGGYNTFNIEFAKEVVLEAAQLHPNWYFIFLNTAPFCNSNSLDFPNIIFLPGSANSSYKTKFINTCDAMLHARLEGETFGHACAEFSIRNKPIITWLGGDRAHIAMLGDKGLYYNNKEELKNILSYFENNIKSIRRSNWDVYSKKYNPIAVMEKFDEVFLQPFFP